MLIYSWEKGGKRNLQCVTPQTIFRESRGFKSLFLELSSFQFSFVLSLNMSGPYDMDARPSAQEAVKRLSSGFSLSENSNHVMSAKDDKSLKLATFSLQGYLKVTFNYLNCLQKS